MLAIFVIENCSGYRGSNRGLPVSWIVINPLKLQCKRFIVARNSRKASEGFEYSSPRGDPSAQNHERRLISKSCREAKVSSSSGDETKLVEDIPNS